MAAEVGFSLPEDIIVSILHRLPVKSIVRFKCVSKRWLSILSDPEFAKSHFKVASEHQTLSHRLLHIAEWRLSSIDLEAPRLSIPGASPNRKLTFPPQTRHEFVRLQGSCNGLVCLELNHFDFQRKKYYIWNPSSGFTRELPDPSFTPSKSFETFRHCGFGYVSATDDYKVFLTNSVYNSSGEEFEVKIFSTRANVWKSIGVHEYEIVDNVGVLLNEALHWASRNLALVVFNLGNEELREWPLHFLEEGEDDNDIYEEEEWKDWFVDVTVVERCLCVSRTRIKDNQFLDLWVMREYDVSDSWTKLCRLMVYNLPKRISWLSPVIITESGAVLKSRADYEEIVVIKCDKIIKCDKQEVKLKPHVVSCTWEYTILWSPGYDRMVTYNESLLWLNDDHGMEG